MTAPAGPLIVVSADGHVGAPYNVYREYFDAEFRAEVDRLCVEQEQWDRIAASIALSPETLDAIDERDAIRSGGVVGSYDVHRRLAELDAEGVAFEVLFAKTQVAPMPFFHVANLPYDAELRTAGMRAYHRWLADFMSAAPDRFLGIADPGTCLDLDASRTELEWARAHGFGSVTVPRQLADADLPPITDPYYEPFWCVCSDLGLVLSAHAGHGRPQGEFLSFVIELTSQDLSPEEMQAQSMQMAKSTQALDYLPRQVLWQLMLGGVFDRHPDLQLVLTEVRADWVPSTLAELDRRFERGDTPLQMRPSEYWHRNCRAGVSSIHRAEIEDRADIGVDRIMFGMDYPHPEGTWPNTRDWIRAAFAGVPERDARLILGENAIDCYRLDRDRLSEIAARIAPDLKDVFGDHRVDERRLEHFNTRAGYARPTEQADGARVVELFDEDLASVR